MKQLLRVLGVMLGVAVCVASFPRFAEATDAMVPAFPCYKCVFNGSMTNPMSSCDYVDTELYVDVGSTICTTFGLEGGSTTCETSGDVCVWVAPWLALTGTGIPEAGAEVVASGEEDLLNCKGIVLAWAGGRTVNAHLDVVVI